MTSHRGGDLRPDAPFAISWRCSVSPRSEPLDRSGTWQLAVPGHLRLAAGPVRGPRTGTRALPPGRPPRTHSASGFASVVNPSVFASSTAGPLSPVLPPLRSRRRSGAGVVRAHRHHHPSGATPHWQEIAMSIILAALDSSAAARPVLETAGRIHPLSPPWAPRGSSPLSSAPAQRTGVGARSGARRGHPRADGHAGGGRGP